MQFDPWVRKIPWRRSRQPTPVSLPGESHGQMSLVVYNPLGCKELDRTEHLSTQYIYDNIYLQIYLKMPFFYVQQLITSVNYYF